MATVGGMNEARFRGQEFAIIQRRVRRKSSSFVHFRHAQTLAQSGKSAWLEDGCNFFWEEVNIDTTGTYHGDADLLLGQCVLQRGNR